MERDYDEIADRRVRFGLPLDFTVGEVLKALDRLVRDLHKSFYPSSLKNHPELFAEIRRKNNSERRELSLALMAVSTFLHTLGMDSFKDRFEELARALDDLDVGAVWPLVKPARSANRPQDRSDIWEARAICAAAVAAFLRAGHSRAEVARTASKKEFKDLQYLAGRRASGPGKAILSWFDSFTAAKVKSSNAVHVFKRLRENLPDSQSGLVRAANSYLAHAAQLGAVVNSRC
jgi:hypothetical protein